MPLCQRQPIASPHMIITASPSTELSMSAAARPTSTADACMGIERKRSVTPLAASVTIAAKVVSMPKNMVMANMPWHQELAVVPAARHGHAAAEQVAEQQDDHHREQQLDDDGEGLLHPVLEVALGDRPGVGQRPAEARERRVRLAAW